MNLNDLKIMEEKKKENKEIHQSHYMVMTDVEQNDNSMIFEDISINNINDLPHFEISNFNINVKK